MTERERILAEITTLSKRLNTLEREFSSISDEDSSDVQTIAYALPPKGAAKDAQATVVEARPSPHERPEPRPVAHSPALIDVGFFDRYIAEDLLGQGGMGEVRLCSDTRIGRSVALKVIRPEIAKSRKLRARFLAEAKVQGQLEHPAIVPVYDVGVRPDGFEYFTMKRVRGRTLHEVIKELRIGDRSAQNVWWTRRRLLTAFQSVCLAIEYAHQRGVIHRDLKPSNVMLGELGEVSVLDWGLAKVNARELGVTPAPFAAKVPDRDQSDETAVGEVLGTPGYMSPEQSADSQSVTPQSDVFALGSILFEMLTYRPLIPGKTAQEVSRAAITGKFERLISKRYPELDIPLELETIVASATAPSTKERYERARQIAEGIERFLEGDRDVERRNKMASKHTREAITALAESVDATSPAVALAARAKAIREVNHALAIDPQNQTALRTMMKLMTDVPTAVAPEAEAAVAATEMRSRRKLARRGVIAYLMCSGNLLVTLFLGVRSVAWLAVTCGFFLAAAAVAFIASRQRVVGSAVGYPLIALTSCGIAATTALFGPFVYAPALCAANSVVFSGTELKLRIAAIAGGLLAMLVPLAAQLAGYVTPSWIFRGDEIAIVSSAVHLREGPTLLMLALAAFGTTAFPALLVGSERDARAKAERELALRAHHLAEMLPAEAAVSVPGDHAKKKPRSTR